MCSRLIQWGNIPNPWLLPKMGTGFLVSSFHNLLPPTCVSCRAGLRSEVDKDGKSQQEVMAREEAVKDAAERSEHESWTQNSVIGSGCKCAGQ